MDLKNLVAAPEGASGRPADSEAPNAFQALLGHSQNPGNGASVEARPPTPSKLPPNAIVHGACGRWWTGGERASHCGSCHETFSSLTAFERHRRGLRCNPPTEVGLIAREKPFGTLWAIPGPDGGYGGLHIDREN